MSIANKTSLIIAIRGYTNIKKESKDNYTDISALDNSNNRVLLRVIDPIGNKYVDLNDVKNLTELVKREAYDSAIIISKNFTDGAANEMDKQKIQLVSEKYMPPFSIEDLYLAIVNHAGKQCTKKCGKSMLEISDCDGTENADLCRMRTLALKAKGHFEEGDVGLLKNDLKVALALYH